MRAQSWRGVRLEGAATAAALFPASQLIYIDALAETALDEVPQWTERRADTVLVLRCEGGGRGLPPGAVAARLPLHTLLPAGGALTAKGHCAAMQLATVLAALDYHSTCGCWPTALAAALPPARQRALMAPYHQRFHGGGVALDSHPLGVGPAEPAQEPLPMVTALCVSNLRDLGLLRRAIGDTPPCNLRKTAAHRKA